jgi:uncharacterized protein YodC (DUF2158 family)
MIDNLTKLPNREINEGSVVCLKSGGPSMTVVIRKADMALCTWALDAGSIETHWLPLTGLEVVR